MTAAAPSQTTGHKDKDNETPLLEIVVHGTDDAQLKLESFECTERISGLFSITAKVVAAAHDQQRGFIGQKVTLRVNLFDDDNTRQVQSRCFTGIVSQQEFHGYDEDRPYYNFTIVPWLWLLSRRTDCRIFQSMRVEKIVETVIDELIADFPQLQSKQDRFVNRVRLPRTERDYCVQYNETTLNFVLRLLEEEGIGFYFEHSGDGLAMVLFDGSNYSFPGCPYHAQAFHFGESRNLESEGHLLSWNGQRMLVPDKYSLRDEHFDAFNSPVSRRDASDDAPSGSVNPFGPTDPPKATLEVYEYGEGFAEPFVNNVNQKVIEEGDRRAEWRLQAERAARTTFEGTSTCHDFSPGFTFQRHFGETMDPAFELLLIEVQHSAHARRSNERNSSETRLCYHNRFRCVSKVVAFRPLPVTQKPAIYGVQTARVVGPRSDSENAGNGAAEKPDDIYVDRFGRVRVQFHWDRQGTFDNASSCWIRVSQGWASSRFGMHFWPRVGDEVVVAFVNGDPDRPLIVGSVYNTANMPPYELPAGKTKSGIKTRSSIDGGPDDFNEIRFEDRKGHEQIYIHAERNLQTVVEASENRSVGGNRTTTIGHDEELTVRKGNRTTYVEKGNDSLHVLEGERVTTVLGNDTHVVMQGNCETTIEQGHYLLQAATRINLAIGASNIVMEPDRLVLSVAGTTLELNATTIKAFAAMIQSTATGPHQVKGLPVAINC